MLSARAPHRVAARASVPRGLIAGSEQTFPVYLIGQLRFAQSLPVLISAAVLLMIGTLTLILVADRVRKR
jgi:ABC-type spermidine/putrescine transport system permease subunit II